VEEGAASPFLHPSNVEDLELSLGSQTLAADYKIFFETLHFLFSLL
jgi:hypothetical protein